MQTLVALGGAHPMPLAEMQAVASTDPAKFEVLHYIDRCIIEKTPDVPHVLTTVGGKIRKLYSCSNTATFLIRRGVNFFHHGSHLETNVEALLKSETCDVSADVRYYCNSIEHLFITKYDGADFCGIYFTGEISDRNDFFLLLLP